jgi:hypothetical protein
MGELISSSMIGAFLAIAVGAGIGYFFVVTRGALIARSLIPYPQDRFHIYWVYSNQGLRCFQPPCPAESGQRAGKRRSKLTAQCPTEAMPCRFPTNNSKTAR